MDTPTITADMLRNAGATETDALKFTAKYPHGWKVTDRLDYDTLEIFNIYWIMPHPYRNQYYKRDMYLEGAILESGLDCGWDRKVSEMRYQKATCYLAHWYWIKAYQADDGILVDWLETLKKPRPKLFGPYVYGGE